MTTTLMAQLMTTPVSNCDDVDGLALYGELNTQCRIIILNHVNSQLDVLRYLYGNCLPEVFPNVSVALRIVLTTRVTVTSAKLSFSKLKLLI